MRLRKNENRVSVKTLGFREIVGVIGMERPDNERERMDEICLKGIAFFQASLFYGQSIIYFSLLRKRIFFMLYMNFWNII